MPCTQFPAICLATFCPPPCPPMYAPQVLRDFQEDPKAAQKHLKSPEIMAKINKLVAAGIIQVK